MIIKPQTKILKRLEIEIDANGQAQVKALNVLTGGPLHPAETAAHLLQIATSMTISLLMGNPVVRKQTDVENEKQKTD